MFAESIENAIMMKQVDPEVYQPSDSMYKVLDGHVQLFAKALKIDPKFLDPKYIDSAYQDSLRDLKQEQPYTVTFSLRDMRDTILQITKDPKQKTVVMTVSSSFLADAFALETSQTGIDKAALLDGIIQDFNTTYADINGFTQLLKHVLDNRDMRIKEHDDVRAGTNTDAALSYFGRIVEGLEYNSKWVHSAAFFVKEIANYVHRLQAGPDKLIRLEKEKKYRAMFARGEIGREVGVQIEGASNGTSNKDDEQSVSYKQKQSEVDSQMRSVNEQKAVFLIQYGHFKEAVTKARESYMAAAELLTDMRLHEIYTKNYPDLNPNLISQISNRLEELTHNDVFKLIQKN